MGPLARSLSRLLNGGLGGLDLALLDVLWQAGGLDLLAPAKSQQPYRVSRDSADGGEPAMVDGRRGDDNIRELSPIEGKAAIDALGDQVDLLELGWIEEFDDRLSVDCESHK